MMWNVGILAAIYAQKGNAGVNGGEERGKEATNGPSGVRAGDATLVL